MFNTKSLFLFRHAKSDWDADYSTDHQRPLAKRGISAAKTMGKLLSQSKQLPEVILCSTAIRARQTLLLAQQHGKWETEVKFTDLLYESHSHEIVRIVQQADSNANSLMLVGHEPTWSSLTSLLIGGGNIRFPTAAMVRIDFHTNDWTHIDAASGQLRWLLQPRFFKQTIL